MNEEEKEVVEHLKKTSKDRMIIPLDDEILIAVNLIEKLQKENEELKADNYELNNIITDLLENIPIQKIKDKIEEILNNKEYRIVFEGNAEFPDDATIINAQKYIKLEKMQELIEERKEK